jgi:hypothetical protein
MDGRQFTRHSEEIIGAIGRGYSSQANKKMVQVGEEHPDWNAQFEFIEAKEPVISVDIKKKENMRELQESWQGVAQRQRPAKGT